MAWSQMQLCDGAQILLLHAASSYALTHFIGIFFVVELILDLVLYVLGELVWLDPL